MNKAQPFNIVIAACALAVGLLGLGFILKSAALDVKGMERTVHVKGLAEMEVPADTVIWPLQFSDADNNLEKLVGRVEEKSDAVNPLLISKPVNMAARISSFVILPVIMSLFIQMTSKKCNMP